ncbi:hypothetical protein ET495_17280 (plasmid) [Xylanimonas allomyrinae]|uniref:Uncharacterized protein n=1 Tax=Xylanimonas allomyrinae TaxID=2509459 RepID=A0A4P6EQ78_9MICO|nr:DUF6668 family protein [Xylanimonas allomyrinae]QAY64974.1 hypothetical protein ET495_17280 [Xylanimonas allomyrinae]
MDVADRLRQVDVSEMPTPTAWIVGVHGGSAETTLAHLVDGAVATGHRWPIGTPRAPMAPVVLVARTGMNDLRAAQRAVIEWASGATPVALAGLVLVADAPGRLPRPLTDLAQVIAGGVPRCWRMPWVEDWRMGGEVTADGAPKAAQAILAELHDVLTNPQ